MKITKMGNLLLGVTGGLFTFCALSSIFDAFNPEIRFFAWAYWSVLATITGAKVWSDNRNEKTSVSNRN